MQRKIASLFIVLALMLSILPLHSLAAVYEEVFSEDFNNYNDGDFPDKFENISTDPGAVAKVVEKEGNVALSVSRKSSGYDKSAKVQAKFVSQNDDSIFSFNVKFEGAFRVSIGNHINSSTIASLRYDGGNGLSTNNGAIPTGIKYEIDDKLTNIKFKIDIKQKCYDLYMNEELIKSKLSFMNMSNSILNSIIIEGYEYGSTIDDIKVESLNAKSTEEFSIKPFVKVLYNENFNQIEEDILPQGMKGIYSNSAVTTGFFGKVISGSGKDGSKALNLFKKDGSYSTNYRVTQGFPAITNIFTVTYDYFSEGAITFALNNSSNTLIATTIRFDPGVGIRAYDKMKPINTDVNVGGQWINVRLVVNPKKQTYDVFINGKQTNTGLKFMQDGVEDVGSFSFFIGETNSNSIIDNIMIYDGDKVYVDDNIKEQEELAKKAAIIRDSINKATVMKVGSNTAFRRNYRVEIDSENRNVCPLFKNGKVLVPARFLSESLNARINYDADNEEVRIIYPTADITMKINDKSMVIDGKTVIMEEPAQIIDGRTYVPLRNIAEALGKTVFWDKDGLIAISDNISLDAKKNRKEIKAIYSLFGTEPPKSYSLYVSSADGKDSNLGTKDAPLATIEAAKIKVITLKKDNPNTDFTVYIKGGSYYLDKVIAFSTNDSGSEYNTITYKNYENETPIINAGKRVTNWEKYTDKIYKADVGMLWKFTNLFENGKQATYARYPNNEYSIAKRADVLSKKQFIYKDLPEIKDISQLEAHIWPGGPTGVWNWFTQDLKVDNIEREKNQITLKADGVYEIGTGSRYWMQGALELLDSPGEFYMDKSKGILYYYPMQSTAIENLEIVAPINDNMITIHGSENARVKNIILDGLTLNNTDRNRNGISLKYSENITVKNCVIRNVGGSGVRMTIGDRNNTVEGNLIYDIGEHGISVEDYNFVHHTKTTSSGHRITNNFVHHVGRLVGSGEAIQSLLSEENFIAYNRVADVPRHAIAMGGPRAETIIAKKTIDGVNITTKNVNDYFTSRRCLIAYNDVTRAIEDSQDAGSINSYMSGNVNYVFNNKIYDITIPISFGFAGIYLDAGSDDFIVSNNLVYDLQKRKPKWGGKSESAIITNGVGNKVINNIFANSNLYQGNSTLVSMIAAYANSNNVSKMKNEDISYLKNIFYNTSDTIYHITHYHDKMLTASDFNNYYKEGVSEYKIAGYKGPATSTLSGFKNLLGGKYEQNSTLSDPRFMAPAENDFRLRYDSPSYSLGFKDIDIQNIGLKENYPYADKNDKMLQLFVKRAGDAVDSATINTKPGKEHKLSLSYRSENGYYFTIDPTAATFIVDNDSVIKINDKGIITVIGEGKAKITTTYTKDDITKSVDIYVISENEKGKVINMQTILSRELITLGGKTVLNTTFTDALGRIVTVDKKDVRYESKNDTIVAIDENGVITANGVGETEVSISAFGFSKTFNIRVIESFPKNISAKLESGLLKVGETGIVKIIGNNDNGGGTDLKNAKISVVAQVDKVIVDQQNGTSKTVSEDIDTDIIDFKQISPDEIEVNALKSGNVRLRITSEQYGTLLTTAISIIVIDSNEQKVGAPWQIINHGKAEGYVTQNSNRFTMISNGINIWDKADEATLMLQPVSGNKYTVEATITGVANVGSLYTTGGIMLRENDKAGAKNVMVRVTHNGGLVMTYRVAEDDSTAYISVPGTFAFPLQVKLSRDGDSFTGYYKDHLGKWETIGKKEISMGDNTFAGFGSFAYAQGNYAVFTYENFVVQK